MQKAVVVEVRARALYHSVVIVVWVAGCVKSFLQADTAACVRYTCRIKTQTRRRRENADVCVVGLYPFIGLILLNQFNKTGGAVRIFTISHLRRLFGQKLILFGQPHFL